MTNKNKKTRQGFSFIEVLIAMALISFLLAGTAELVIRSLALERKADVNLKMAGLVQAKLEGLKSLPYESGELQADSYNEMVEESSEETFLREWTIEDTSSNMKRIGLAVCPESHPEKMFRISLFLSKDLGF
jgi:prepilin-type N-terminal cleavage/methylation domain-containing protein